METTYKDVAAINDLFKRIANTVMPVGSAQVFLNGLLELEGIYDQIDKKISATNLEIPEEESKKELDKFLDQKITLNSFPIVVSDPNIIQVSPVELLRLKGFVEITT